MTTLILNVSAVIFDLDGVLVDSRAAVDAAWTAWSRETGIALDVVARTIPGRRTSDAVRLLAPNRDAQTEAARIIAHEQHLAPTVTPIPGAAEMLGALPLGRWGIATSGTREIAQARLMFAGLPIPDVLVCAEMVTRGKPAPDAYLRAAELLGVDPAGCAVFEDAPDGVTAALRAGCKTVGVLTWASRERLATPFAVRDLRGIRASATSTQIALEIEIEG